MNLTAVLIANRGEIAVRIARAARDLGIRSIAVYSQPDTGALHTRTADEAYALPGATASESYLNIPALLDIAARVGADCVHPGYGFLSENADFARAVVDAGMTWIGPSPEAIETLGDKVSARQLAESVGAPLAPGTSAPLDSWEEIRDFAAEHGLPVVIKAAFGGGGRGLKIITEADGLDAIEDAFRSAGRESQEAFGRAECFVEKFLTRPRHVEAQVLADSHGTVAVLGTRDCSTQRRFQKLVEEAPAPFLTEAQHRQIVEGARDICRAAGYLGAGTVEFIIAQDGTVSFLEVNTRVQVEHPITEVTSGVDIVAEQFCIADGQPLSFGTSDSPDPETHGHAIEFRINAEDIANGFVPCPGTITAFEVPTGPGIRVDAGVSTGSQVPSFYDSLLGKLIVWGPTREVALRRAESALGEFRITGVRTVLPFHRDIIQHPAFTASGAGGFGVYTDWVDTQWMSEDRELPTSGGDGEDIEETYSERMEISVEIDGRLHRVGLPTHTLGAITLNTGSGAGAGSGSGSHTDPDLGSGAVAPFDCTVVTWAVPDGAEVHAGQTIVTVEAMKMERTVVAPTDGILSIQVSAGERVHRGAVLATVD